MNDVIRRTQKKYGSKALVAAILVGTGLVLAGQKAVAKGLVLGTLFSVLNFVLIGEVLPMVIGKTKRASMFFSLGSLAVRFGLLSIPLIVALKMETLNFAAAVVGIFMVQFMILADHLFGRLFSERIKRI